MKKSKMKKVIALLLVAVMCACMFAGCGPKNSVTKEEGNKNQASGENDKTEFSYIEFSYLRPVWGEATYQADGPYETALCEAANVDIDVQVVPVGEYDTKALLVAGSGAKNMPDVMWAVGPSNDAWYEMEEQGAFYPIEDLLEKYPTVKGTVSDEIWETMRNEDGHIYFIPHSISSEQTCPIYYRKDWFDKLGIKEPTTIDELEDALVKIQKEMPDVVPMTIGNSTLEWICRDLATCFGAVISGWTPSSENANKIIPMEMNDGYKEFLFWMQDMSKRGLLDAEAGLNANLAFGEAKFKTGKAAVLPNHLLSYQEAIVALKAIDPNAEVGVMSPLKGPDGTQGGTLCIYPVDRGFYFNGQLDAEKVDRIFQFLEWSLTDGSDLRYWGIEGKTYKVLDDGTKAKIADADREADYKHSQIEPLEFLNLPAERSSLNEATKAEFVQAGLSKEYDYFVGKVAEYNAHRFYNYRNTYILSPLEAEQGTLLRETYLAAITGSVILDKTVTKARYDEAVTLWLAMGGQAIVDEVNKIQTDKSQPKY